MAPASNGQAAIIRTERGLTIAHAKLGKQPYNNVRLMTVRQPRYSKEEFARRGNELYESQVRSRFQAFNRLCLSLP